MSNDVVVEQLQYEPYGASAGSTHTRYDYTGRERDQLTGLMFNRARWYDPQQGRFLTEDPIGIRGGLNLYSYASNNPISFSDPFGLDPFGDAFDESFKHALVPAVITGAVITGALILFCPFLSIPLLVAGGLFAIYGVYRKTQEINSLANAGLLCPDDVERAYGHLFGGLFGGVVGGIIGGVSVSAFAGIGSGTITSIGPIVPDPPYIGVEFVDSNGGPLGEFDRIEGKNFIEEKDGTGLNKINPKTGKPNQTPEDWAEGQIFDKTVTRIDNLPKAVSTRTTPKGSPTVPSLAEIQGIRSLEFEIKSTDRGLQSAVELQIQRLQARYPNWTFTVKHGK